MRVFLPAVCLFLTVAAAGCSNDTTTPTVSASYVTDTIAGTAPAAVNGVAASDLKTFTISSSGTISVALTAANETLPNGTLNPNVVMSVTLGTFANGVCTAGLSQIASASGNTIIQVSVQTAGTLCLQTTNLDVTPQSGPVSYSLLVNHPQ
jgi:hypothetical protein